VKRPVLVSKAAPTGKLLTESASVKLESESVALTVNLTVEPGLVEIAGGTKSIG